jgi:hypothetical protein
MYMAEFGFQAYLLSAKFIADYPLSSYPELMYKQGRSYICLLIETHEGYFLCVRLLLITWPDHCENFFGKIQKTY